MLKDLGFYHLQENTKNITEYKIRLFKNCLKNCCLKTVHIADEFLGNKIDDAVIKLNDDKIVK